MASQAPNVLLLVADGVRATNLSLHGYRRRTTPYLDDFAADATVYTQARSPSNNTLESHTSLFTGLDAAEHRITPYDQLNDEQETVWSLLTEHGYSTACFSANTTITDPAHNLINGFDHVHTPPETWASNIYDSPLDSTGPNGWYYGDQFLTWADEQENPWGACLNLMDAHPPYEPVPKFDKWTYSTPETRNRDLESVAPWHLTDDVPLEDRVATNRLKQLVDRYDGGIRQIDAVIEHIIGTLKERDQYENTLIVVTSDHGQAFGELTAPETEPPAVGHGVGTHESLFHVPLLVKAPNQSVGRTIREPATPTQFKHAVESYLDPDTAPTPATATVFSPESNTVYAAQQPHAVEQRLPDDVPTDTYRVPVEVFWKQYDSDVDGTMQKYSRWGMEATSTLIENTADGDASIDAQQVRDAFTAIEPVPEAVVTQPDDTDADDADSEDALPAPVDTDGDTDTDT